MFVLLNKLTMLLATSWLIYISLILAVTILLIYNYMTRNFNYWKDRRIPYIKPLPILGNTIDVFLLKSTTGDWLQKVCDSIKQPYFGIFIFDKPCLIVRDPCLVKNILIKDFSVFRDRSVASGEHDNIMKNLMFFQKNPDWKINRSKLAPIYTTGKLKKMVITIDQVGKDFEFYMEKHIGDIDDLKILILRYSIEVICQTTFGLKPDCFENENSEFFEYGERMFAYTLRNSFSQMCYFFKREWVDMFHLVFFPKDALNYFVNIFLHSLKSRRRSGQKGNDIFDILEEINSKGDNNISDTLLATGALQVFVAGYETTSATLSFLIYELAKNPQIQNRLREEVTKSMDKNGGITFEALSEMKYLDMCISETLRRYPVLPFLDRTCDQDYNIPGTDDVIEKGMTVFISIQAIHFDENFFPNPYQFDPERFEGTPDFNKDGLTYLPFGAGPRVCFGERFALLVMKTCICHFLSKFEVMANHKTQEEIKMSVRSQLVLAEGGLPMKIKKYSPVSET